ncbi:nuclear transport factor 2 family protein [Arthrobacter sunyaminii]|uniref:nuclear transport factor 2 family protein n=1 Tax=Arthrobacter sunyaminii TaxID=2816859 RepID=UPI001A940414|nr:nuclear transport factor 2 family protein [Arthrobacter sunyaminii]MBO0894961.1 nuclear transport factor 2 family protein [Arthrobacter sunyaminii]
MSPLTGIAALQERIQRLEDHQEILGVLAAYGPAVDSGSADAVAELWTRDGSYTYSLGDGEATLTGPEDFRGMVHGPSHQKIIAEGSSHFLGIPDIRVSGDTAVATGYSMLVRHRNGTDPGYYVDRLSANRWELARTGSGWKVTARINSLLDGRAASRQMLAKAGSAAL